MTTPEEFYTDTLDTLAQLNDKLPRGSNVIITGLADGRILWDTLYHRMHPLGEYKQDSTYEDVYTWLECLQVSPCNGWMTANETLRNFTSERAFNLSMVAKEIVDTKEYSNFDMLYYDFDINMAMDLHESRGGERWQLIEAVDGFHPSQTSMVITSEIFWDMIMDDKPEIFGDINPFNAEIQKLQEDVWGVHKCEN